MLDTTAAGELIAYLERFVAAGKSMVMFEHRHEYLDGGAGLQHLKLEGRKKSDNFLLDEMPQQAQKDFSLDIKLGVNLGGRAVLKDLELSLAGGQIVAVVGRNGVGKTTLLRALAGLQKYSGSANVVTLREISVLIWE